MTLQQLLALLAKIPAETLKTLNGGVDVNPAEIATIVNGAIDTAVATEKATGIANYQSKDAEIVSIKKEIKDAGYDPAIHGSIKNFITTLKTSLSSKDADNATQLARIQALEQKNANDEKKLAKSTVETAVLAEMKEYGGVDMLIENLINGDKVKVVNGEVYFKQQTLGADGQPTETLQTFKDGIGIYKEKMKDLKLSSQLPGNQILPQNNPSPQAPTDLNKYVGNQALAIQDAKALATQIFGAKSATAPIIPTA